MEISMDDFNRISAFLDEKKGDMIAHLIEITRIPSISDDLTEVKRSLRYILDLAIEMGFSARSVLDERIGIIEFGDGPETLGILAHVDVVEPGSLEDWDIPPFEPALKDNKVWGRGTLDDKGAVIMSLYALLAVRELGLNFQKKVQIIIGTREEVEWTDIDDYVKEYPLPDYGFTPDGEFPLCNIEKGFGGVDLSFPLESIKYHDDIRAEDLCGKYSLLSIDTHTAMNIIPSSCTAILLKHGATEEESKEIKLTAGGYSVHACMPEKGDNAIINMCNVLKSLPLTGEHTLMLLNFIIDKLAGPYCESLSLGERSEFYNGEFIHKNCMSPTVINTKNNRIEIYMDMRIAYGTTIDELVKGFEKLVPLVNGKVIGNTLVAPTYISKELPFMKEFADSYEKACGIKNEFMLAYGGSYAKAMPNIVSWGPIFPGEEDTCHEPNEFISVNSMMITSKIYAEAIRRIALSDDSFI